MSEALENIVQNARNESEVGYSAMYWGSFGGPKFNASMGPAGFRSGPSFGAGGGYGPVSRMNMDPLMGGLRRNPMAASFTYAEPEPTHYVPPYKHKEPFEVYDLGATEIHVHKSGFGSIKEKSSRENLYDLNRYRTAMLDNDLGNEIDKMVRYCNKRRDEDW